jgi:hypothetical protein
MKLQETDHETCERKIGKIGAAAIRGDAKRDSYPAAGPR